MVKVFRCSRKPVVLAANKVDDQRHEAMATTMWNLGLGEPYPVSAMHGRGSGDLLDAVLAVLPEAPRESFDEIGGPRRVAIVGKPNVGKSSLLNKLAQQQRAVVSDVSGTTVDPVDLGHNGQRWCGLLPLCRSCTWLGLSGMGASGSVFFLMGGA